MRTGLLICITLVSANLTLAQTPPAPAPTTSPSSASSPHQRETTSKTPKETPAANSSEPSAASTPHQKQVTEGTSNTKHDKMINDCITKRQSETSSLSKADAKKSCEAEMKTKGAQ